MQEFLELLVKLLHSAQERIGETAKQRTWARLGAQNQVGKGARRCPYGSTPGRPGRLIPAVTARSSAREGNGAALSVTAGSSDSDSVRGGSGR